MTLYKIPIISTQNKTIVNKHGDVISSTLEKAELIYKYFIYKNGAPTGVMYDTLHTEREQRIGVDSFLQLNTLTNLSPFFQRANNNDTLVSVVKLPDAIMLEKYVPKAKLDESYDDTTFLYFNRRLSSVPFSFSPALDTARNAKLVKVRIRYNGNTTGKDKFTRAAKEVVFSMETIEVSNQAEIRALFMQLKTFL